MGGRGASSGGGGGAKTPFTDEVQERWITQPNLAMSVRAGMHPDIEKGMEEYIDGKPPVTDRLYRGIELNSEADLAKMEVGSTIDMQGISSWSTDSYAALEYSSMQGKDIGVVFQVNGTRKGARVLKSDEGEVIISKKARWTVVDKTNRGDDTYFVTLAELP